MSAPALNTLSPAPANMTPRTAASYRASSKDALRSAHVLLLRALRTFGRLRVTYAMLPFFAYITFSRLRSVVVALMKASPLFAGCLFPRHVRNKGAKSRDSLAYDQVLHLKRAFVGVERFRVREEPGHF